MTEPTTKDQAIALAADIESDGCCAHKKEAVKLLRDLAQPPAPDCRTCEHRDGTFCGNRIHRGIRCTNGDQYQPAPQVVLWRTE